jgi:hypothetical protein
MGDADELAAGIGETSWKDPEGYDRGAISRHRT